MEKTDWKSFQQAFDKLAEPQQVLYQEPLSRHTTFQIGGPADMLFLPRNCEEVAAALQLAQVSGIPVTVLGNGSNVLVLDGGVRGLVIKIADNLNYLRQEDCRIIAGAGALLQDVSRMVGRSGLTGMEFAVGIPGTVGGAVYMNAGAYHGEISAIVEEVRTVSPAGEICSFQRCECGFSYRHSIFQDNGHVICEVRLTLCGGEAEQIHGLMVDYTQRREDKQPLERASAGSTFKRPPGYFAGTLIEQAGLKGYRIGGAKVSTKHAGFVINAGGATARDVLELIEAVRRKVHSHAGVWLEPEVRIIGEP